MKKFLAILAIVATSPLANAGNFDHHVGSYHFEELLDKTDDYNENCDSASIYWMEYCLDLLGEMVDLKRKVAAAKEFDWNEEKSAPQGPPAP